MSSRAKRYPAASRQPLEHHELIDEITAHPARTRVLNEPERHVPEQAFSILGAHTAARLASRGVRHDRNG
jgi:hypothetical protein